MVLDREERPRGGGEGRPASTLSWCRGARPDGRWRESGCVGGQPKERPRAAAFVVGWARARG
jgi:hypothetical protein